MTTAPSAPDVPPAGSLFTEALLRPQGILARTARHEDAQWLPIAALYGAMLLPVAFVSSQGTKFHPLWSNPITWVAVGIVIGLFWIQAIAFPATWIGHALGGRGTFASSRFSVALSLLPCCFLLFGYWLLRLAAQPDLASWYLAIGWPFAAFWSLRNLRLCLLHVHRTTSSRARATAAFATSWGLWTSLLIGLVPHAIVGLAISIQGAVWKAVG